MDNPSFDSQFNMAIAKLMRIDKLILTAHEASIKDDHTTWKVSLDGVYREIWAYLDDKKDNRNIIDELKKKCQKGLLEYMKWISNSKKEYEYVKQEKQQIIEELLDEYERLLIQGMKNRGMDMPGHDDVTRVTMKGRY